jgi:hypothetical protein
MGVDTVNCPLNVHLKTSKMRLSGLNLEILDARLKNSFGQNFLRDEQ